MLVRTACSEYTPRRRALRSALCAALVTIFFAAGSAGPALAAPPNPAKEHFDSAQDLFDKKKYEAALVLFRQAYEESKSPNARLMVARTLLALGRLPEAHDELTATVAEAAAKAEAEPKYAKARDAAAAELAPLEARVGKLVLTFATPSPNARVSVNGALVPEDKLGVPMAVLPGTVEIVVEGPTPSKRNETVTAGQTRTIVLGAPTGSAAPTGATSPSATPTTSAQPVTSGAPDAKPPFGTVRAIGIGVTGIGIAGLVLFGVSAVTADGKLAQLEKECGGVRCTDPKYADVVESGKTFDLLTNIGLGVGIAGLAAGTAMIIFGGPKAAPAAGSAMIDITPSGASIRYRGSF